MEKQNQENIVCVDNGCNQEKSFDSKSNIIAADPFGNGESSQLFESNKNTVGEKIWSVISKKQLM